MLWSVHTATPRPRSKPSGILVLLALVLLFVVVVIRKAWVTDDAYITFRCIDNWLGGYGLTWNPPERVQVFTHPLWLLLMTPVRLLSGEFFYSSLGVTFALSLAALLLVATRVASSRAAAAVGLAAFACSRAFTDYATSGLENALSYCLLAWFVIVLWNAGREPLEPAGADAPATAPAGAVLFRTQAFLAFLAALVMLNRLDHGLLVLPALVTVLWRGRRRDAAAALACGMAPLGLWLLFALVYFGSPVPNTAVAKLQGGIAAWELTRQGIFYLWNSLRWDPVTLVTIATALVLSLRLARRDLRTFALGLGVLLYVLYVVRVGGDFMSGRFLTAPFFVAVLLWTRTTLPSRAAWAGMAALLLFHQIPFFSPFVERNYGKAWDAAIDEHGIADERVFYIRSASLLGRRHATQGAAWPSPTSARDAARLRRFWWQDRFIPRFQQWGVIEPRWPPDISRSGLRPVVVRGAVGYVAFYLGPTVHVLDYHALADPFLALLPAARPDPVLAGLIPRLGKNGWRIGHLTRIVPEGYLETLASGHNAIRNPELRAVYAQVRLVARGDLFAPARLRAMWDLHRGALAARVRRAVYP